ncbi:MAG: glycosyltransferase family 2 protein [Opitutales bacterium]
MIPARNEARNLPGCLAAIGTGFAEDIVVVDSSSEDTTEAIAREAGVRYVNFHWNGRFPKKRNWFLREHRPNSKWVLFLDADEYLTDAFKNEVRRALCSTDNVGFWLNYTKYFLGKSLKGGYPLRKLALFRVGAGEYEQIPESEWSTMDMEVHEHPELDGPIGEIKARIDHRDFRSVASWLVKHVEYAKWEAKRFEMLTQRNREHWTPVQKIKYALMGTPLIGPVFFFGSYLLMGGFRDGARGFAFCLLKAAYFTQVYCLIKEQRQQSAQMETKSAAPQDLETSLP